MDDGNRHRYNRIGGRLGLVGRALLSCNLRCQRRSIVGSFARIWDLAAGRRLNLDGVLSWAFEFENQPWFAGYRQLSTNGVDLPVLNVFRLFAKMGPERIAATSSAQVPLDLIVKDGVRDQADIGALATRTPDGRIAVRLWHYHDDDVAGPVAQVKLDIAGAKAGSAKRWRVDGEHGNAFTAWQRMGSPASPNEKQYGQLEAASVMQEETLAATGSTRGGRSFTIALPRQGVALLTLDGR